MIGVPFADGSNKVLTLATKRPMGFTADETTAFMALILAFAMNLEIQALRRTTQTLLDDLGSRQRDG